MFTKILLCSDGSEDSLYAAHLAALFARQFQSRVTLLNVFDFSSANAMLVCAPEAVTYSEATIQFGEEAQKEIVERTGAVLAAAGVAYETRTEMGHPVDRVVTIAETEKHDLIVVGSRGLRGFERFLLGSVSDGILHHAPCPVLLARGEKDTIQQALAPSDGSEGACRAVKTADAIARQFHASLTVLNVFAPDKGFEMLGEDELDPAVYALRVRQVVTQRTDEALQGSGTDYRLSQEIGHPAEAITRFAEANGSDLIVMGSRGLGTFQRMLVGSVSENVAHHAHCPVLIMR